MVFVGYVVAEVDDDRARADLVDRCAGEWREIVVDTADAVDDDLSPVLTDVIDRLAPGDTLVVTRLSHLGHSLGQLAAVGTAVQLRSARLHALDDDIDPDTEVGAAVLRLLALLGGPDLGG